MISIELTTISTKRKGHAYLQYFIIFMGIFLKNNEYNMHQKKLRHLFKACYLFIRRDRP